MSHTTILDINLWIEKYKNYEKQYILCTINFRHKCLVKKGINCGDIEDILQKYRVKMTVHMVKADNDVA
jgi:hypothetical protein